MSLEFHFTAQEPPSTFENTLHKRLLMHLWNTRKYHGLNLVLPATGVVMSPRFSESSYL